MGIAMRSSRLQVMSWSDNLFTFADTARQAIRMQLDLEEALAHLHHLQIKQDSRECVRAAAAAYEKSTVLDTRQRPWTLSPDCRILGPQISCNGSTAGDLAKAFAAIRCCYFRNARFLCNQRVPLVKRLQKLDSVAHGIIRSRAASWPPCRTTEEAIDHLQFQILSWMLRLRKAADETPRQYAIRRGRAMSKATVSQWSLVHLESCLS